MICTRHHFSHDPETPPNSRATPHPTHYHHSHAHPTAHPTPYDPVQLYTCPLPLLQILFTTPSSPLHSSISLLYFLFSFTTASFTHLASRKQFHPSLIHASCLRTRHLGPPPPLLVLVFPIQLHILSHTIFFLWSGG